MFQMDRHEILNSLPNEHCSEEVTATSANCFHGFRSKDCIENVLLELTDRRCYASAVCALQELFGEKEYRTLEARTYNTLHLRSMSNGSRFRLRCTTNFHGKSEISGIRLKNEVIIDGNSYLYGTSLLFLSIGFEDFVLVKLYKTLNSDTISDIHSPHSFLDSRSIFVEIMADYTLLETIFENTRISLIPIDEVYRQEQFCCLGVNLLVVNHFCWSNIFSVKI